MASPVPQIILTNDGAGLREEERERIREKEFIHHRCHTCTCCILEKGWGPHSEMLSGELISLGEQKKKIIRERIEHEQQVDRAAWAIADSAKEKTQQKECVAYCNSLKVICILPTDYSHPASDPMPAPKVPKIISPSQRKWAAKYVIDKGLSFDEAKKMYGFLEVCSLRWMLISVWSLCIVVYWGASWAHWRTCCNTSSRVKMGFQSVWPTSCTIFNYICLWWDYYQSEELKTLPVI